MATVFAERFMIARQERNFTQQSVAKRLGVTPQAISKWETGASLPDIEMLRSIAVLLDCSMDYLMGHEVTEKNKTSLESLERKADIEWAMQKEILELRVGVGLVDMLIEEGKGGYQLIHEMRTRVAARYGIPVPIIRMMDDISLPEKEYRIILHGKTLAAVGRVEYPLSFYLGRTAENPEEIEAEEPIWKNKGVWKQESDSNRESSEGNTVRPLSAMQMILYHLEEIVVKNYSMILNRQMVADMVELVQRRYPAVAEGVVPEKVSYSLLQKVITGIVKKGGRVNMLLLIQMLEDKVEEASQNASESCSWDIEALAEEFCRAMPEAL